MKKIKAFTLASIFILVFVVLAGCQSKSAPSNQGNQANTTQSQTGNQSETPKATSNEEYVMVSNVAGHPYWLDAQDGGRDAAAELGVKWTYTGPSDFNTAAQVTTLEQIIAKKPAGIIVAALQPDALTPAINKAVEAGIPVVTVDTDAPASKRMTYLGTDNYQAGRVMGERLAQVVNGNGNIGLATVPGQFNLEERIRGIKDVLLQKYPNVKVASIVDDKNDDSATATAVVAMLQANPDIKAVASINAVGAGVAAALRQANKVGQVKAVTFDITDPILNGIEDGTIDSTIVQRTYMMTYLGVKLLYNYNHRSKYLDNWFQNKLNILPNAVDTGVMVITKDQARAFKRK
ncbi:Fructose import binding protein FrcB [Neomoorella glycerini]|uniref:Fructose import binding protein FrcB n=1 Tax=Neomoorella glycerini TaxID=55779 RepID=A0A6I5ZS60_9FIRM|nr:substrate-binding domain-containing protein [Moorella glycerini]QGP92539.1 Fructose import binding protein FrcB [Moorella glycerini]